MPGPPFRYDSNYQGRDGSYYGSPAYCLNKYALFECAKSDNGRVFLKTIAGDIELFEKDFPQ